MREVPLASKLQNFFPKITSYNKKVLSFASIGNGLELYNYSLYGVMVPFTSLHYFPSDNKSFSMTMGYLSFALAFLIAPFGSVFWGWIGERYGRLALLQNSLILMALPTLGMALLPSFSEIGYWAPILLFALRLLQGLSASGEVFGSRLYAMESLGEKQHGIASGYLSASGAVGVVLSMLMGFFITRYGASYESLWRLPFFLGACFYLISFLIRFSFAKELRKTPSVIQKISKTERSLFQILKNTPRESLTVFALSAFLGVLTYMILVFLNPFLMGRGMEGQYTFLMSVCALLSTAMASLLWGYYQDFSQDLERQILSFFKIFLITFPFLFAFFLSGSSLGILLSFVVLGTYLGLFTTLSAVKTYRVFDASTRCRGAMFNYSFGCSFFGGLTPYTLKVSGELHPYLPGLVVFLFTVLVYTFYRKVEKNVSMH